RLGRHLRGAHHDRRRLRHELQVHARAGMALRLSDGDGGHGGPVWPAVLPLQARRLALIESPAVMRALVMGGTEFISLHLLQALRRRGHEATVFNRGRNPERLPAGVSRITGDRKDHPGLRERLRGQRFDGVFDVTYAPTLPEDVAALLDALEGSPHVVFVSTARVYDHHLPIPY